MFRLMVEWVVSMIYSGTLVVLVVFFEVMSMVRMMFMVFWVLLLLCLSE